MLLGTPAGADASGYCVGAATGTCSYFYAGTGDGLQTALDDSDSFADLDGSPDTVYIGPGNYLRTNGAGFQTYATDLTIEGSGQSTVLTSDTAFDRTVLNHTGGGAARRVSNLRVDLAGADANGIMDFKTVSDVRLTGPGGASEGIRVPDGGRLTRATIDPAAIAGYGVDIVGSGVVEDVLVRLRSGSASAYAVVASNPATPTAVTTLRHLTLIGDGAAGTRGVRALESGAPRTLQVNLRDSILRNFEVSLERTAAPVGASATIDFRYTSLSTAPGKNVNSGVGDGAFISGPGNLGDVNPMFAGDFNLLAGSALIDAGDPAGPEPGDSATDAAGNPRIIGARRDIGAFESSATSDGGGGAGATAAASDLVVSPKAFAAAAGGPSALAARKKRKAGAKVNYTLNVAASVNFTVRRSLLGRRKGKGNKARCVAKTKRNARARRCTRIVTLKAGFSQQGKAGTNSFRFTGRLGNRKLKPGRYVLVATPSTGGKAGNPITAPFRIVR